MGARVGISTWTKGALDRAAAEISQTKADHPEDQQGQYTRAYVNVLLTDSVWTGIDGTTLQAPASQDPVLTAQDLHDNQDIRTFVVVVAGNAQAQAAADQLAVAGGTMQAIDADTPAALEQALASVVDELTNAIFVPECIGGLPHVMILLDASSSMLNINLGQNYGGMGETGWDQGRDQEPICPKDERRAPRGVR